VPSDSGLAFVVVLHLDPTKESSLSSILALHTTMSVSEVEDGLDVAPNHVYVIAPNNYQVTHRSARGRG
jgi:two-component system, chemotaxis family, CheB/CheR fusion protein